MTSPHGWNHEERTNEDLLKRKKEMNKEIQDEDFNQPRKGRKKNTYFEYFKEFTSSTSLHGLKYIGEDERPITERLWWIGIFAICVAACVYLILQIWIKWQHIPVIVNFAESTTPIWQISFPAVTICSQTRSLQTIFNFTDIYHKNRLKMDVTETDQKYYDVVSLMCGISSVTDGKMNDTYDRSILDMIEDVGNHLDDMFVTCVWESKSFDCNDYFHKIITEDGICYTFNILDASEMLKKERIGKNYHFVEHGNLSTGWNLHEGYPKEQHIDTYPRRGLGSGVGSGLTIMLMSNREDQDHMCNGPYQGFKVSLHTPAEIPRVSQNYVVIPHDQNVVVSVKPNMMTTSNRLIDYDPAKRNCFFPFERKLKYFHHYTRDNCLMECISNYTAHVCGCTSFFMAHDQQTPICGNGKNTCVSSIKNDLLMKDISSSMKVNRDGSKKIDEDESLKNKNNKIASMCNCLPGCTSISYDVESSQSDFQWREYFMASMAPGLPSGIQQAGPYEKQKMRFCEKNNITFDRSTLKNPDNMTISSVTIFFKEPEFIMSQRSELYGKFDFLANCGGLLGLCLGFSILSLFEIIYFLTLRAFCNFKRKSSTKSNSNEMNER